jgi:hypothetical protein
MPLQYFLSVAIALFCLAPAPGGDRSAQSPSRTTVGRAGLVSGPTAFSTPTSSTTTSVSRPSLWRHRIKSVLEEQDAPGFQPVDLGQAVIPDRQGRSLRPATGIHCSLPSIPLRC